MDFLEEKHFKKGIEKDTLDANEKSQFPEKKGNFKPNIMMITYIYFLP